MTYERNKLRKRALSKFIKKTIMSHTTLINKMSFHFKNSISSWHILLIIIALSSLNCKKNEFPPSEFEIGHIELGAAYDLCLEGSYAYVTCNEGMAIINIADLNNPIHITTVSTDEAASGILVENGIAFLGSGGNANCKIIDVINKNNPIVLSSLFIPNPVTAFATNENTLFLSTWGGELYIIDISDLESPEIISSLDCQGIGTDLAYLDKTIFYANGHKGLQVIDVSDLNSPILNPTSVSYDPWDIDLKNDFLYLGRQNQGFSIFEIEADNTLSLVSSENNGGETWGVSQEGDKLFIADLQDGVETWDISNKSQPTLMSTIEEYSPHDIVVRNGYIFLADQDRHFVILDI